MLTGDPQGTLSRRALTLRWAAIAWIVVFWRLGYASLLDPDEAHYAQLTREMWRARSWFVPLLDGAPFIDKPVLYHWLQLLFVRVLGESELAMRLPSFLAALALFAITRWAGTALLGATVGETAAVMFATLPLTFALSSLGVFDMFYSACLFGSVACLLVAIARERPRLQYPGYALLTLAVMTKGPIALLLVVLLGAAGLCAGRECRQAIARLHWGVGLLVVVVAASPWFVWMWTTFGDRFVREYLLAGNLWYFTEPKEFSTRSSSSAFYLRSFVAGFFPWSLLMMGRGIDLLTNRRRDPTAPHTAETLLWLWSLVVIGFFTAARFKLDYYIFPAAPACCILAAREWQAAAKERTARGARLAVMTIAISFVAVAAVSMVALFRINLDLQNTALALPAALALGRSLLLAQVIRRRGLAPASSMVPSVTLLAVYVLVVVLGLPILERSRPTAPLGRWIARHSAPGKPVGMLGLDKWRASIRYYSQRRLTRLDGPGDLDRFLDAAPEAYVLMSRRDYLLLQRAGTDIQEVAARDAIVGHSGRYFRRQVWGKVVVVTRASTAGTLAQNDLDIR